MKRFLLTLIIYFLTLSITFAFDKINDLENYDNDIYAIELSKKLDSAREKTLKEKFLDVYHLEIEEINTPKFLLSEILTSKYSDDSIWESTQFWGAYSGNFGFNFAENESFGGNYSFDFINIGLDGKLKNNNADFRIMLNVNPLSNRNFAQNLFADMYIATNRIPHHRLSIGNTRPPVGMEGGYSPFLLPFIARSQISRNFGTVRKLGSRLAGNYSLVDYDLGLYSSDTYFQEFFPGTEFVGWINLKPLGLTDGRYGKITLGGGIQSGNRNCDYTVKGAYFGYEYKKMLLNFEWSDADGYNGPIGYAIDKHAGGFYSTLAYRFTPKLQGLIRYDQFDPNKDILQNNRKEYVLGFNYFIKGQALKVMLNYVFCQNDATKDSHRLILGTQILL